MNKSFELYDLLRDPVIVLRNSAEVYRNPAAASLGALPADVTENTPPFETTVTLGGVSWQASVRSAGDCAVCFMYRMDADNAELMAALGVHISEWLTELTVAVNRFNYDIVDPQTEKHLSMIRHSVHAVRRAAGNLQYLFEPEVYAEKSTFDLDETVFELVDSVNALSMGKTAKIVYNSDEKPKIFTGSQELIERALLNLLSNSMRATPKEGKITVNSEKKGKNAIITVTDEGEGIPEEVMNVLFTAYTAPRSLITMNRLGLGLAVTQKIIQKMGGTILASNRKPKGAKFVIKLPVTENYSKLSSPEKPYQSKGMTLLQTELSCVLDYRSYGSRYGD